MEIITTENAPLPLGTYSQAVKAGAFLYISGQIPLMPNGEKIPNASFEDETRQVFENLKAIAEAAGVLLSNTVKMTVYLKDLNNSPIVNEVMGEYVLENHPARVMVEVSRLPLDVQVEIDAIVLL